ncbi:MAG TPA: hypothetical protein VGX78_13830 [Pirellulales bacterium]|nr:hypothetical protein [Pirellulales bacterium]
MKRRFMMLAASIFFLAGVHWIDLAATQGGRGAAIRERTGLADSVGRQAIDRSVPSARSQEKCTCGLCACSAECHGERCACKKPCSCEKCGCPKERGHVIWAGNDGPINRTTRR